MDKDEIEEGFLEVVWGRERSFAGRTKNKAAGFIKAVSWGC